MANNEIDIYGVLNSATVENIIAKAEQISFTLPDKSKTTISEYVKQNVQFRDGNYISSYIAGKPVESAIFVCTITQSNFTKGHFYFYSGVTQTYEDITPEGTGGGGGGGGTTIGRPILTVQTQLKDEYTTSDIISLDYYWSSENTGYGKIYVIVDGTTKSRRELPMNISGDISRTWEVGRLGRGVHNVQMYVIDSSNITSAPRWSATFTVGGLEVESEFNDAAYFALGEDIEIPITVYNSTENDYKLLYKVNDMSEAESDSKEKVVLSGLSEGSNIVEIRAATYLEDGTIERYSNVISYTLLVVQPNTLYVTPYSNTYQPGNDPAYVVTSANQSVSFTTRIVELGGSTYSLEYSLIKSNADFTEEISSEKLKTQTGGLGENKFAYAFDEGYFILRVQATSNTSGLVSSCDFKVSVSESKYYTIDPVTKNLLLWLDATGKSNDDADKETWKNKITGNDIPVKMYDFNYSSNGWLKDSNGNLTDALTINSRAYVEIGLEPFADGIVNGLTLDVEFEIEDVSNSEARAISCFSGQRGLYINTEYARIGHSNTPNKVEYTEIEEIDPDTGEVIIRTTKTGPFEVNFQEKTRTHITFVVYKKPTGEAETLGAYPTSCMIMYIDGVMAAYEEISSVDNFKTLAGQTIFLGANPNPDTKVIENHASCKIYNLRVYDRALTMEEVTTNFVYDIKDPELKNTKIINNKLGEASANTARLIPEMTFTMFPKDFDNITKSNKQKCIVDYQSDTDLGNFNQFGLIQWQGTSTLAYAVKNYRITFYDVAKSLENVESLKDPAGLINGVSPQEFVFNNLSSYGKKQKYDIGNGQKESKFTLKADYMDSSNARNTGTAMFIPSMGTEETPIQKFIPSARTCIYGFPMRCYLVTSNISDDGIPNPPSDAEKEFLGIYNFNLDKDSHDSIGLWQKNDILEELSENQELAQEFTNEYPYWDTLGFEISANSNNSAGAFADSSMKSIVEDFEVRYPDEGDTEDAGPVSFYGTCADNTEALTIRVTNLCTLKEDNSLNQLGDYVSNNEITGTYVKTTETTYKSAKYELELIEDGHYRISNYLGIADEPNSGVTIDDAILDLYIQDGYVTFTENVHQRLRRDRIHLQKLVKWTKDCSDEEFYRDFEKHYNLSAVLDYYLLVLCNGMVDNLGKNMMIDTYGPGPVGMKYKNKLNTELYGTEVTYTEEEIAEYDNYIWYPHFYDMD